MIKPYDIKEQPAVADTGELKPRARIELAGHGHYVVETTAALSMFETELEMMFEEPDAGDHLSITVVMMTDEKFEALPEFQGW